MSNETLEPLSPISKRLLDIEKRRPDPALSIRERVAARVATSVGSSVLVAGAGASAGLGSKILGSAMLVLIGSAGGAGLTAWWHWGEMATLRHELELAQRQAAAVPSQAIAVAPIAPRSTPVVSAPQSKVRKSTASLSQESVLLERSRTALLRGDAVQALVALDEYSRLFPRGRLIEERDALEIQVLARLGRSDEARKKVLAFQQRYPASLLLDAVRRAAP